MIIALILLDLFLITALVFALVQVYKVTREDYDILKYHNLRPDEEDYSEQ